MPKHLAHGFGSDWSNDARAQGAIAGAGAGAATPAAATPAAAAAGGAGGRQGVFLLHLPRNQKVAKRLSP